MVHSVSAGGKMSSRTALLFFTFFMLIILFYVSVMFSFSQLICGLTCYLI